MPFSITLEFDNKSFQRELDILDNRRLEAAQRAANNVAFDVRKAYIKAAKELFHNPTPFFTNAWFVEQTRDINDKSLPLVHIPNQEALPYWLFAIEGGVVQDITLDRITRRFRREGVIKARESMVSTRFLTKNRYDNIPPTFYQHFFTRLTPYKRGSNNSIVRVENAGSRRYFLLRSRRGRLIVMDSFSGSAKPVPVMTSAVLSPARPSRFDLEQLAQPGLANFQKHFDRQFAKLGGGDT